MIIQGIWSIFGIFDYLVYKLVSTLISVNISIASAEIFSVDTINEVANRIYVVVGVVMLFKLVISAVQFLVNPDGFEDKEKGLAGIIKKTIISLALMVLAPAIFDFLIAIQTSIISTIPRIVFGDDSEYRVYTRITDLDSLKGKSVQQETDRIADNMAFTVLSAFVEANSEKPGGAVGEKETNGIHDLVSFKDKIGEGCGDGFLNVVGSPSDCKYNYMIIISTICGGFLCYVLLSMTLDVAIRTIKFGIIRMLAPIPISSYIFSKDKLNKFIKTTATVYFDLFIRLFVIFFIIFAIKAVMSSNILSDIAGPGASWFRNAIVNIAIICGLFMFAKNAPKFISELLGLPDIGSGDMADMFKPAWQRYGGAAGALVNPVRTAAASALTSWQQSKNIRGNKSWWRTTKRVGRAFGAGARGAVTGTFDSAQGVMAGDDWSKMRQRMKNRDTRDFKKAYEAQYYRTLGRKEAAKQKVQNRVNQFKSFLGQTPVDSKGYSDAASTINSLRSESFTGRAKGEVDKAPAMFREISARASTIAAVSGGTLMLNRNLDGTGGREINTKFTFKDAAGKIYNCDYEKIHVLFEKIRSGNITQKDYDDFKIDVGHLDAAGNFVKDSERSFDRDGADNGIISDLHERAGKKAYSEYVDIAVAAQRRLDESDKLPVGDSHKLSDKDREFLAGLADREVLDRIIRFREAIVSLNITDKEKEAMLKSLDKDPGGWLAGANKTAQEFSTRAAQMAKMEQASSSNNGNK